ncbi:MAG: hypothetical protein NTY53_06125 [Kiritimatiellaeota bacterium]|nr:hypothetical protein [Kiritimatiellota bacterium]
MGGLFCLLVSCSTPRKFGLSESRANAPVFFAHADQIRMGTVVFHQESLANIFSDMARRSKENDPTHRGIRFVIPVEFRHQYKHLAAERLTLSLGSNVTLSQVIHELPLPGWVFFPLSETDVAVIPADSFTKDENIAPPARQD